jgi:uroporphyrinogen-III synthase
VTKTILYLGTDPAQFKSPGYLIHYPVIKIIPRSLKHLELNQAYADISKFTHLLFTSKTAVKIFFGHLRELNQSIEVLKEKIIVAIGAVTAGHLSVFGLLPQFIAQKETQEGVVQLLNAMDLHNAYFFMPRSSLSRPIIANFFHEQCIRYRACELYDTVTQILEPKPDLDQMDEIVFTSPSTVSAFLEIFGSLPHDKRLIAIGPVTQQALDLCRRQR